MNFFSRAFRFYKLGLGRLREYSPQRLQGSGFLGRVFISRLGKGELLAPDPSKV